MEEHFGTIATAFLAVLALAAQALRASSSKRESEAKIIASYQQVIAQLTTGEQQQLDEASPPELAASHQRQRQETFDDHEQRLRSIEQQLGEQAAYDKGFSNGRSSQGH
jgi:hypothetical protein